MRYQINHRIKKHDYSKVPGILLIIAIGLLLGFLLAGQYIKHNMVQGLPPGIEKDEFIL